MKRSLLFLSILLVTLSFSSCKKDKDEDKVVKYEVVNSDGIVFSIEYTGADGNVAYDDNPATNWSKEVRPNSFPFTAKMQVDFENGDVSQHSYILNIKVNGEVKATTPIVVGNSETTLGHLQYVVE